MDLVVDASMPIAELLRASGRARLAHRGMTLFIAEQTWSEVAMSCHAERTAWRGMPP
jgi:hypothetical protein